MTTVMAMVLTGGLGPVPRPGDEAQVVRRDPGGLLEGLCGYYVRVAAARACACGVHEVRLEGPFFRDPAAVAAAWFRVDDGRLAFGDSVRRVGDPLVDLVTGEAAVMGGWMQPGLASDGVERVWVDRPAGDPRAGADDPDPRYRKARAGGSPWVVMEGNFAWAQKAGARP